MRCAATMELPLTQAQVIPHDFASGEKAKALDILRAIKTMKQIEGEERPATEEEKKLLRRFPGLGPVALSIFPDPITGKVKDGWKEIAWELQHQLSGDEFASAKRTTFTQFFTSPIVMAGLYNALERMGVPSNASVLEPGCGAGYFMSSAPSPMRFIGVELDSLTGRIARALNPQHDIRIEDFAESKLPQVDAVIGNPPFSDLKIDYAGQKFALHDFFIAKSLDALRPHGILGVVTSHYTLDRTNAASREYFGSKADFLGAVRLPSDTFKREGTSVVTDLVFFRKRAPGEHARHQEAEWQRSRPVEVGGAEVSINRYFTRHPEQILGTLTRKDTLYGEGISVLSNGDLAVQLQDAIARLPAFPKLQIAKDTPQLTARKAPPKLTEGSFFVNEHEAICQVIDGQPEQVTYGGTALYANGTKTGKRMAALIRLRECARRVLQSQNDGEPEADREEARRELNHYYDRFDATFGPINLTTFGENADGTIIRRMPNIALWRQDPDAMLVLSLEEYNDETGKATKSPIMVKDVVGKNEPIKSVRSAEEGLLVSLDRRGTVDLKFIAELYGKAEKTIIDELGELIYLDPTSKEWQTADVYLSGNVRAKLMQAKQAGPSFACNATALEAVQPEDVLPGDIDVSLGAPWVPATDIQAFAADLFKVGPADFEIAHIEKDAVWSVTANYAATQSVAATSEFGTTRISGIQLFEQALNMKTPVIYDAIQNGDREERVVNHEQTLAAKEKQRAIKERFKAWIFTDPERTERLVRYYNDHFNNIRLRQFDGSHLEFPGMSTAFTLRPHQKAAVWRGMTSGNTLLAHCVGAGKTACMAATGMKMKQAGLIKKPIYVVPNHLLEQFAREFQQIYPNAKLLVATKDDVAKDRRKLLTAKIASGEWDGILITHSSFERIGMSRKYQQAFLEEQIKEYNDLLIETAANKTTRNHRNLIKTIEKQKAARQEKLKALFAEDKKDDGLVFDELGVDHIFVDESQAFKNLESPTKMERISGIQTGGSERAFDLYMKARFLHQQHPGHGLTFASGTPISNSLVEMYTLQRYLDPDGLRSRGIEHFDAWAATFGEVIESMEISPDGKSLKPKSRFARFVNLPELQSMFRTFADVQTAEMLQLPRPSLEGGKPHVIARPMSDDQYALQQELVERYERLRTSKVDPREDNALKITTEGRKLALDARMLAPSAPGAHGSKLDAMVDEIVDRWRRTADRRGTQMIFCDMGVNPTPWGYSVYGEIAEKLIDQGIPREQIAMVGEADSDAKKFSLFDKVRQGLVRILIGSTSKLGTGTNVQKRLAAMHHLDAPWKPAEVEQRDGRILRQGNEWPEVAIYRYVTEGSFDAYMWQTLERKAAFIAQIMTGECGLRRAEDIGGQELSYAEVKAIASGNPAVLTLAEADAELQRLSLLKKNHADEQYLARRNIRDLPETIRGLQERLSNLTADGATVKANQGISIGDRACTKDDVGGVLANQLNRIPENSRETRCVPIGTYCGLQFGLILHSYGPPDVYLQGKSTRTDSLSREHQGPRAVLNALARIAGGYDDDCNRTSQNLAIAQAQLRDYQARLGQAFPHEAYLTELTALRELLKASLGAPSNVVLNADAGPTATAGELATKIKELKAGNTIDAAPARNARARSLSEEPVTSRLRRMLEATPTDRLLDVTLRESANNMEVAI